jgi:hypothetical protein
MAKKVIETLVTELTADGAKMKKELDASLKNTQSWGARIGKITKSIAIGGIAGGAAFTAGLVALTKGAIDSADALSKQSQSIGMAIEDLSALQYAADMSGVSSEQLGVGLKKLSQTAVDAFQGIGAGADAFEALDISVKDSEGNLKNNAKLLDELADRFSSLPDGANKTALAMDIFGKSGADLIPLLNGGSDGIRLFREEAERLGLVIDSETGKAAEVFNDNISKLNKSLEGLGLRIAKDVLPALNEFTDEINDPETQEGLANIASGIIGIGAAAVSSLAGLGNFTKWLAESAAAAISGPAADDIVRLEDRLAELELRKKNNRRGASQALETEIAHIRTLIGNYYELQNSLPKPLKNDSKVGQSESSIESKLNANPADTKLKDLGKNWEIEQQREMALMMDREKKAQEAADKEVAIQRDKFARIHEEMLQADNNLVDLENYRNERNKEQLAQDLESIRNNTLLTESLKQELENEFRAAAVEQEVAHQERLKQIKDQALEDDLKRRQIQLEGAETLFGALGDLTDAFGGRSSRTRKALLIAEKASAIASATIAINKGIAEASSLKFPANLAAMAAVAASTAGLVGNIQSVNIAHGGLDNVPKESTYLLDKGERVVSPKQNRDLTSFLQSAGNGGITKIEVINNISGVQMSASAEQNGETMRLILTAVDNKLRKDLNDGRGVWREAKERFGLSTKGAI